MNKQSNRIAVFLDAFGTPTDYYVSHELAIYEKKEIWRKSETYPLTPITVPSIPQIRLEASKRLLLLDNCRAVAASGLSGIPYSVFTARGLPIFTIDHLAEAILDSILADVAEAEDHIPLEGGTSAHPIPTREEGVYTIDLAALQIEHPDISSKMALMDFLENIPFMELVLRCQHLPPWIVRTGLYEIRPAGTGVYAIRKRICEE